MSKKNKKISTVVDSPSSLSPKSKKQKTKLKKTKTKTKKPKPPQQPPPLPPPFSATSLTLQSTKFKKTTTIATATQLIDQQISLYLCISNTTSTDDDADDFTTFNWYKADINSDLSITIPKPKPKTNPNWYDDMYRDIAITKPKPKPKPKPKIIALSPICSMPNSIPQKFRSVQTLDSKIYALGGIDTSIDGVNPSCKAFVCDFSNVNSSSPSWEELPPMESAKVCPAAAVSSDGKVYVLGSLDSQLEDPWAEFFDPTSNSWTQLPSPPIDENPDCLTDCVFARDRNELVYFSSAGDSAYSFDLYRWSWKCINVDGKEASYGLGKSVAVGDVVYTFQKRNLYAFDLSMETPSLEPVYGLEKATAFIGEDDSVFLACIGYGRMCLVSARQKSDGLLNITCSRFSVGTYSRNNRFHAVAVLDNSAEFVAEGSELHDCLAVATPGLREGGEHI